MISFTFGSSFLSFFKNKNGVNPNIRASGRMRKNIGIEGRQAQMRPSETSAIPQRPGAIMARVMSLVRKTMTMPTRRPTDAMQTWPSALVPKSLIKTSIEETIVRRMECIAHNKPGPKSSTYSPLLSATDLQLRDRPYRQYQKHEIRYNVHASTRHKRRGQVETFPFDDEFVPCLFAGSAREYPNECIDDVKNGMD